MARIFHVRSQANLRSVCLLGFGLLIFNEYLQMIPIFGRTFDYFDILFSAMGLMLSYFVFGKLYARSLNTSDQLL
jgi:hypothetical protein